MKQTTENMVNSPYFIFDKEFMDKVEEIRTNTEEKKDNEHSRNVAGQVQTKIAPRRSKI
jgi:hypothetical protein